MIPARVGPFIINIAFSGLRIKVKAIVIGVPHKNENPFLKIQMLDHTFFFQLFCNFFDGLFAFKRGDRTHSDQVRNFNFHRHGAAIRPTRCAKLLSMFCPGGKIFNIHLFALIFHTLIHPALRPHPLQDILKILGRRFHAWFFLQGDCLFRTRGDAHPTADTPAVDDFGNIIFQ